MTTATETVTIRCQDCPDWEYTGVAAEARAEWVEHRMEEHDDYQPQPQAEKAVAAPPRTEVDEIMDEVEESLGPRAPEPKSEPEVETRPVSDTDGENGRRPRGYWTAEQVIQALQAFHREHGRSPTQPELRSPLPGNAVLTRIWGSMGKAYEAAGIPVRKKGGRSPRISSPPPTPPAKGQPKGQKPTPIAPEPVPAQASEGTPEGTLVERAAHFSWLVSEIVTARARLADFEEEARSLLDAIAQEIGR